MIELARSVELQDTIAAISAQLDLRQPNREALESIAVETMRYFDLEHEPPPFEAVLDVATGVGKTYILAAAVEYFAVQGVRDFAVITPGRTILSKTVNNFTPGHPKSLLFGMEVRPVVITSDNFNTPVMRAAMDDPQQVKLYVFTVQALIKPETKIGRKTHKFQEGLGEAFYAHLQGLTDLVVFADEHHTYYGPAFSSTIRQLRPHVLLGLTATPHRKTPPDQIIYRYPLAAAVADRLVKTPVLVGRRDDRSDPRTKLLDGVRLLEVKEQLIERWCATSGATPLTPIMLVIAPDIAEADEIAQIVADPTFVGGRYADKVLTVHSRQPDEALTQLDRLEDPGNPYRIVVSVGMLKEGWDVKNVYVIASLRASVSEILTEQTLGRGLRLPFGRYTGIELLDTLEVLGHERYEDLLRKSSLLNEHFIDLRTRSMLRPNATGDLEPVTETTTVSVDLSLTEDGVSPGHLDSLLGADTSRNMPDDPVDGADRDMRWQPAIVVANVDEQIGRGQVRVEQLKLTLVPRTGAPPLCIPRVVTTSVRNPFSLADITDLSVFRRLGEDIAADPSGNLRRVKVDARIVIGTDGLRRVEMVTTRATDAVASPASLLPVDELRQHLIDYVLASPVVPARANQVRPATEIVDQFLRGVGVDAAKVLSAYLGRASAALLEQVAREQRRFATKPTITNVVELTPFNAKRTAREATSSDRYGTFQRGVGYVGYSKSLYAQDWFDSSTERAVANLLDDESAIVTWVRLQRDDLPILWTEDRTYHPDFIAIERSSFHWIIEVKMDRDAGSDEVLAKREAARRWANHVNADGTADSTWRYLLASEHDVETAKGSWPALKARAGY